ncbi:MAG: thioredoxin family protein [Candidatus Symbiothrix sp.]|nr:thioredoxin family protein [Candidatus Symbiothrix sp.]
MKRTTFFILSFFALYNLAFGQSQIKLDFPGFAGKSFQLYYSYGSKIDSTVVVLDNTGKADFLFPYQDFRGLVQFADRGVEVTEFVVGEPVLNIVCYAPVANNETVTFPGSEENAFFREGLRRKTQLMEQLSWLQAGYRIYGQNAELINFIQKESGSVQNSLQTFDATIDQSPLYAARFLQWVGTVNRMYEASQQRDPEKIKAVANEMETTADIQSLYTSGQLWDNVHKIYINMFNQLDDANKQEEYAASINRVAARLSGPVQESFFSASVVECERINWIPAQQIIVQHIAETYADMEFKSNRIQRLVGMYKSMQGVVAPVLIGLEPPAAQPLLVIFYESGCGNCTIQLAELKKYYPVIRDKGFRIVSVSADEAENVYEYHSKDFPWEDKLCDYKGFEGENFLSFGVIGTPSIFIIDKDGIIQGRYGRIVDTGVLE